MTLFLASVVLGIVPMVVYALIVWRLDRWEKEPIPLLIAAFLWGAVPSIIFAVAAQSILGIPAQAIAEPGSMLVQVYQASIVAPITEELLKGTGLFLLFVLFRREIDSVLDGLIYGSMIGFGFAAVENIFYFLSQENAAGLLFLFFLRAFIFGMLHALFTGLTGVGLALGKFSKLPMMRFLWPLLGVSLAIFTHALHNYFATLGGENLLYAVFGITLGLVWFFLTIAFCLHHENRWIRLHLAEEVENGVLYAEQAIDTAHFWTRSSLSALSQGFGLVRKRRKLLHEATELAFEKQRQQHFGTTPECLDRIARLRELVRRLSREDPLVQQGVIQPGRRLPPPLPPLRQPRVPPPLRKRPPPIP
jgi:RsiW-degrading membrane proteinase PrsW (M82 family)